VAPLAAIGLVLGAPLAVAALPGIAVGFLVTLQSRSARTGLLAVAVMGALALVSTLAAASTPASVAWLGLVGAAYGLSGLRGWHRLTMQMAIWCSYIVVNPLQAEAEGKLASIGDVPASATAALTTAAAVLAAGAPMALLARRVMSPGPAPAMAPLPTRAALTLAVACGGLLAVGTLAVFASGRLVAGEWLLLTIVLLLQPDPDATLRRAGERLGGTIAGAAAAAGLSLVLGGSPLRAALAFSLMAAAFAFYQMPDRYWAYVTLFTPGLILLSAPPTQTGTLLEVRIGATLAGALAVALVALALRRVGRPPGG
jgi:hypothetical protein